MRVCLIGAGVAARGHVRAIRAVRGDVEISVAARDSARAEGFARELALAHAFRAIDEVWTSGEDLVVIATPPSSHGALLASALDAGKHILLEKPAFRELAELHAFLPRLRAHPRFFMVGENARFAPLHLLVAERVRRGDVGEPLAVSLVRFNHKAPQGWKAGAEETRGGLHEGGIHWLSRALQLSGVRSAEDVTTVRALEPRRRLLDTPGDDTVLVEWRTRAGIVGSLWHSWGVPRHGGLFDLSRVDGTAGSIAFDLPGRVALRFQPGRRAPTPIVPVSALAAREDASGSTAMWRSILDSIERGAPPEHTLDEAIADLSVVDAAYRSLASGRAEAPSEAA